MDPELDLGVSFLNEISDLAFATSAHELSFAELFQVEMMMQSTANDDDVLDMQAGTPPLSPEQEIVLDSPEDNSVRLLEPDSKWKLQCASATSPPCMIGDDIAVGISGARHWLLLGSLGEHTSVQKIQALPMLEPIKCVKHANGNIAFSMDSQLGVLGNLRGDPQWVPSGHSDTIRDLALRQDGRLLSVGFDGMFLITDLDTQSELACVNVGNVLGSTSFYPYNPDLVAATADVGDFLMLDMRAQRPPQVIADVQLGLYAHAFLSQHHLVLGFSDGSMLNYDIRNLNNPVASYKDPRVFTIGELHAQEGVLFVAGEAAFSQWAHDGKAATHIASAKPAPFAGIGYSCKLCLTEEACFSLDTMGNLARFGKK